MSTMTEFKNAVSEKIHGISMEEAQDKEICIHCKKPIYFINPDEQELANDFMTFEDSKEGDIWTWDGVDEYRISALCEHCFEKITRESGMEESEGEMQDYGTL